MSLKLYNNLIVMGQCQTKLNLRSVSPNPINLDNVPVRIDSSNFTKKRIRRTRSKIILDIVSPSPKT